MLVSVVIPCHNNVADTRACLATLRAQTGGARLEILVVDNGSTDATPTLADQPDVQVLRQATNLGFAGGVNAGLRAARGDVLLVLNNDTLLAPPMLERLLRALAADRRIAIAGPVSNYVKGPARIEVGSLGATPAGVDELERRVLAADAGRLEDVDTVAGLCWCLRRELCDEIGLLDERFGIGNFEDDDFSLRARLRGHRLVIARDAFLHHHGHRTFDALGVDYVAALRERERAFRTKWRADPAGRAVIGERTGWERAADAQDGLAAWPAWPDGQLIVGRALLAQGELAAARARLEAFVAACPLHTEANAELAFVQIRLGELALGAARLDFALDRCSFTSRGAADLLARFGRLCLESGRLADAIAHLEQALEFEPGSAESHNLLGAALLESSRVDEAAERFAAALERGNAHARANLGICRWRQGRPDEAIGLWRTAAAAGDPLARQHLERVRASDPA